MPPAALDRLAEADGFAALGSDRRVALWQVKALAADVLPLFAAADRAFVRPEPELVEPEMLLPPMRDGQEVVEDYRATGLTLRQHPVAFLRPDLDRQGITRCADLEHVRDGRRVVVAGIVLVRQKPGSAKGVMFITIEDEGGVANLILWPDRFEAQRALVFSAGMIACHGRVQREGEVVHVITERLDDLSGLLRTVGDRDDAFPLTHGRGDGVTFPGAPDRRGGQGIRVATRDFR